MLNAGYQVAGCCPNQPLFVIFYSGRISTVVITAGGIMRIRRQDQEIISYLKLLGAGFGAILSLFIVLGLHDIAKNRLADERQYLQKHAPLLALSGLRLVPSQAGQSDDMLIRPLSARANQTQAEPYQLEKGFWAGLSVPALSGICLIAAAAGLVGGYWSVWLLAWIGTFATIKLIRSVYSVIWCIKPDFDGGKCQITDENNNVIILRDKERVLPGVLVISVMGVIGLLLLSLVVYYFVG
jgi:hypothetical protein